MNPDIVKGDHLLLLNSKNSTCKWNTPEVVYTKSLFCLVTRCGRTLCITLHCIVSSVCVRPCLSVSSMALSFSVNVIRYHYTKLIAGYIDSLEHLNQRKSHISKECCEAKVSLCFARRIENNKCKENQDESKRIQRTRMQRTRMQWSRWLIEFVNAFTLWYQRVWNDFGTRSWCSHVCELHCICVCKLPWWDCIRHVLLWTVLYWCW